MPVKINGATSGSVTLAAPATGSDVTLTLPAAAGTAATTAYADSAGGLQLITSQSFSAVSSVSVNNCFSATYENYQVVLVSEISGADVSVNMRYRASGANNTNATYVTRSVYLATLGVNNSVTSLTATAHHIGSASNGYPNIKVLEIGSPNLAARTTIATNFSLNYTGGVFFMGATVGNFNNTTTFDGFSIFPDSGTITGTVRVYGYKNGA